MAHDSLTPEKAFVVTPIGTVVVTTANKSVTGLYFTDLESEDSIPDGMADVAIQLKLYFDGKLQKFDVSLNPDGSDFQKKVWNLLLQIPYGTTSTYGELARNLGLKNGARAVGLANRSNPVSIIIPCHRVIGTNGNLTGYAGGLWRKKWLLNHELPELNTGLFEK